MRLASYARRLLVPVGVLVMMLAFVNPADATQQRRWNVFAVATKFVTQAMAPVPTCMAVPDVALPPQVVDRSLYDSAFVVGFEIGRPLIAGDYHPVIPTFEQSILLFEPTPALVVPDGWLSPCEAEHAANINGACFGFRNPELSFETLLAMSGYMACPTGTSVTASPIALEAQYIASADISRNIGYHQMLGRWDASQWDCLDELWTNEAGWAVTKSNYAGSGAYGIPQALPGNKMSAAGADWETSASTQITWGLGYIADRYGSPCSALVFKHANGWY